MATNATWTMWVFGSLIAIFLAVSGVMASSLNDAFSQITEIREDVAVIKNELKHISKKLDE